VLLSVNILFLAFVIIQFQYFFGGQSNISYAGFTYSEYARRGFGEMIAVAFLSLVLFLGLGMLTRRSNGLGRKIYSILGMGLVLLVGLILISAFQRLVLYETAYGFSRIRAYTYVFMIWLGILLVVTVVLELFNHLRTFALAALFVSLGFGISLTLLNIDGFIVRENVSNSTQGKTLDTVYLVSLSDDATPDLFDLFHNPQLTPELHTQLGVVLVCRQMINSISTRSNAWQSFNWSRFRSQALYQQYNSELKIYQAYHDSQSGLW
jgi:hypothetical protein